MIHYPRVHIEFCTKCRWNLRAAWYAQELLSTFGNQLGEVAMVPADSGVFRVWIQATENSADTLLWDRKSQGFPDSKDLKQLVRDIIDPKRSLGHSDRKTANSGDKRDQSAKATAPGQPTDASGKCDLGTQLDSSETENECVDCEK